MCALLVFASCKKDEPIDEAKAAGKSTADFPQIAADVFKPMDGGIDLSPEEIMGRNTWNLWSGGNEHFWNHVAQDSFGLMDLLKMLDNRKFPRGERFKGGCCLWCGTMLNHPWLHIRKRQMAARNTTRRASRTATRIFRIL